MMFQRFLDATDYWFGYSDTSSAGSYDPACECFMVAIGDVVDDTNAARVGDGENPRDLGTSAPATSLVGGTDINTQLAQAPSSRQSSRRSTARYDYCSPPLLEKPPHVANMCAS
jgi:hypothetical protein